MSISSPASRPLEVHGHRGCRGLLPENTIPAFLHALALGVDVLEMDVIISADHQVVVSHEPWLSAHLCLDTAGQPISPTTERDYNLYQLPYATIRQADCGCVPQPNFPHQQLHSAPKPLLSEVLATVEAQAIQSRQPIRYSIEIKSDPAGDGIYHPAPPKFLELVIAELATAGVEPRTSILSFDPRVLRLAHSYYPSQRLCLLVEDGRPWLTSVDELGFVPAVFGPNYQTATATAIQELRQTFPTIHLVPWTVNDVPTMRQLREWGIDGITTDYPDLLLKELGHSVTNQAL